MSEELEHIHHVAIVVADVAAAVDYYCTRFSVAVDYQDDSWALLRFANTKLALVTGGQHPPHFAVERDQLDAKAAGRPIAAHRDGTRSLYLHDPWHNVVELLEVEDCTGSH